MSWGSHSRLLERAIINVQALIDCKNPSVLLLNINKNRIFAIQLYFLYFSLSKMITALVRNNSCLSVMGKFKKNVTVQFFCPHALNMEYFYLNLSLKGVF